MFRTGHVALLPVGPFVSILRRRVLIANSAADARFPHLPLGNLLPGGRYGLLDSLNKKFQDLFGITKAESTGLQG